LFAPQPAVQRGNVMRNTLLLTCIVLAFVCTGCVSTTAVPAVQGKAYVVDGSIFGTSMYHCEVVESAPHCWEVVEAEPKAGR
jgi:hypothetical protein